MMHLGGSLADGRMSIGASHSTDTSGRATQPGGGQPCGNPRHRLQPAFLNGPGAGGAGRR